MAGSIGKEIFRIGDLARLLFGDGEEMRKRLAELNPAASARVAQRLIEASERDFWQPDEDTLEQLERAGEELEDRLEGITETAAA